jgi:hypothetical protein
LVELLPVGRNPPADIVPVVTVMKVMVVNALGMMLVMMFVLVDGNVVALFMLVAIAVSRRPGRGGLVAPVSGLGSVRSAEPDRERAEQQAETFHDPSFATSEVTVPRLAATA